MRETGQEEGTGHMKDQFTEWQRQTGRHITTTIDGEEVINATLAERLTERTSNGEDIADACDDLGLDYEVDRHGYVHSVTDGTETAVVVTSHDGIYLEGWR